MVCFEENENMRKYLEKSGLASIGDSKISLFIYSKDFFSLGVHLIYLSFPSMLVIHLTISEKSTMNLLKKITFLRKD